MVTRVTKRAPKQPICLAGLVCTTNLQTHTALIYYAHRLIRHSFQARIQNFEMGGEFLYRNQRNQILFQYLKDKKKKERRRLRKKRGWVKIHPFHLPWIRTCLQEVGSILNLVSEVMILNFRNFKYQIKSISSFNKMEIGV